MWFLGLVVVLLIGAVAVVASGRWGAMSTAYDDRPDVSVPARQALTSDDIGAARFGVALRGYRMDEVDGLLERVAREVAERDRRIADLERAVTPIVHGPEGAGFSPRSEYDPADFDDTGYNQPILVGGAFPEPTPEPAPEPVPEPAAEPAPEADAAAEPEEPPVDKPGAEEAPATGTDAAVGAHRAPAAPAEPADAAPAADDAGAVLDEPPAQVPLPPMLQELVQTREAEEPAETWFTAKEPPPDHDATTQAPGDDPAEAHGVPEGGEPASGVPGSELPDGDAEDVNVAQRPRG